MQTYLTLFHIILSNLILVPGYPNASAPAPYIRVGDQVVLKCWSFGGDPTPDIWFTVDGTNATSIKGTGQTFSWAIEGTTKTQRTYTFVADRTDNKRVFDCNVYNGYNLLQGPLKRSVYIMMESKHDLLDRVHFHVEGRQGA